MRDRPAPLPAGHHETFPRVDHTRPRPRRGAGPHERFAPFTLEIQTVPPLDGMPFLVDGLRQITNAEGALQTKLWHRDPIEVEALVAEFQSSDVRVEFARWSDAVFTAKRELEIPYSISIEAGFHVSAPVRFEFTDLEGTEVPAERIDSVELRSSKGDVVTFEGDQTPWLQSIEVLGRDFGLDPVEVVYAVQRVVIDGSSVVNRGQQRFTIAELETPRIELLLYPVRFQSRDALFNIPMGRGVRLEYPDGYQEIFPLDGRGELQLSDMARGTYRSAVTDAPGFAVPTTFVLSRAQDVDMLVISVLDILAVSLFGVVVLGGLLMVGRPELVTRLRSWIFRRRQDLPLPVWDASEEEGQG